MEPRLYELLTGHTANRSWADNCSKDYNLLIDYCNALYSRKI